MLKRLLARFADIAPDDAPALPVATADDLPSRETITVGGIVYRYPWRPLPDGGFEDRLDFEVTERHPLWGQEGRVIGQCEASDEIAVALDDGRFAIVHLTWSSEPGDSWYPSTEFYACEAELSEVFRHWWPDEEDETT